ncbi:MAG: O-antigen ligase family protein [Deltaproteobacteria bacterium]
MQAVTPLHIGGMCLSHPTKWERNIWERVVPFLVLVNIALNPFSHSTAIREVSFYSAAALLIFYFFRYRDWSALKTRLTLPVVLFTVWTFVGLFWALDVSASFHDIRSHLLKYIVFFLLLTIFFNSRAKIRLLFWTIIISVVIAGFYDIYFFYVVGKNSFLTRMCIPYHQLPVGPLGFMALFGIALVVHLWRTGDGFWGKCALIVCFGGLFLILFVTQMRSLIFALPFVIFALFWDNKKLLLAVMLIVFFCLYFFSTQLRSFEDKGSNSERLAINYMSLLIAKEYPITGTGFSISPPSKELLDYDVLRTQIPQKFRFVPDNYNTHHNSWLGLMVRLGLVGLLLSVFIVIRGVRICFAGIKQHDNREVRLTGQLCLCLLVLFSVYGLFNEVFMHLLEALLSVVFAMIALLYCETQKSSNPEIVN